MGLLKREKGLYNILIPSNYRCNILMNPISGYNIWWLISTPYIKWILSWVEVLFLGWYIVLFLPYSLSLSSWGWGSDARGGGVLACFFLYNATVSVLYIIVLSAIIYNNTMSAIIWLELSNPIFYNLNFIIVQFCQISWSVQYYWVASVLETIPFVLIDVSQTTIEII